MAADLIFSSEHNNWTNKAYCDVDYLKEIWGAIEFNLNGYQFLNKIYILLKPLY